jgi:hypothetical protein
VCVVGNPARPESFVCRCGLSMKVRHTEGWCSTCNTIYRCDYLGAPFHVVDAKASTP